MQLVTFGMTRERFRSCISKQIRSKICWSSCLQMMMRSQGVETSQEEHVLRLYGSLVNLPARLQDMLSTTRGPGWNVCGWPVMVRSDGRWLSPEALLDELDCGPVMVCCARNSRSDGHALVLFRVEALYDWILSPFGWLKELVSMTAILADPDPYAPLFTEIPWYDLLDNIQGVLRVRVAH